MTSSQVLVRPPAGHADATARVSRLDTARDEAFLRAFYERHGAVLLRFALRLCQGDWHRAEDIVQETALRAWQHQATLDPTTPAIRTWLFRVIRNLVIDQHRAQRARPTEVNDTDINEPSIPDPAEHTVELRVVTDAMAELGENQREILLYVYYLGLSVAQTSDILGIPPGTVKSRAYYAVRALRATLDEHGVTAA